MKKIASHICNAAGFPKARGLYDPNYEHDSCGVGFVANIEGFPQHEIVEHGIQVLTNLEHRGAIGGDKATSDGAGVLVQIPHHLLKEECPEIDFASPEHYAVAMVFLPSDPKLAHRCLKTMESIIKREGCKIIGTRDVPVDSEQLGELARITEPKVVQVFIGRRKVMLENFERKLYVIRRLIEKEVQGWKNVDASQFYIVSMSSHTVIYKGLLTGSQLPMYYPDLDDIRFTSAFA
ncbi:glutamate synthase subunit alpha, partial [candidate division KSB1 bacterium]|nr:glutamate synthase subunit alpha [candidate division KSB1 bacterium]